VQPYNHSCHLRRGGAVPRAAVLLLCGTQALVINELTGETFSCDSALASQPTLGHAQSPDTAPVGTTGCVPTGEQQIALLSFQVFNSTVTYCGTYVK
jgi:hypothetical protein